jgi:diguanylate cyclase (GGDEF)-like protein
MMMLAVIAASAVFGVGGDAGLIRVWLTSAVYILVAVIVAFRAVRGRSRRRWWAVFAVGLALYGLGNVLWAFWIGNLAHPPIPSVCDGLWLMLYPLSYVGLVGLARVDGQRGVPAGVWLDGIIAGGGLAAIGAALVFRPVLGAVSGSTATIATELAYPIGDLLLAALVVGVLALRGWRIDRTWGFLGGGFLLLSLADCMYALQVANGSISPSAMTNLFYVLGVALLAFAAWQTEPDRPQRRAAGWSVLLVPTGFAMAALGLLLYDHFQRLDPLAFGLAVVTLLAAFVRMGWTFADVRSLSLARHQATTDDLTSLPNRRLFMARVGQAIAAANLTAGQLSVLILDLDNFKELNDTLGHNAGDRLLCLIGPRLSSALRITDVVARLGGDEFAVLLGALPNHAAVSNVAEKVLDVLRAPFEVQGLALHITASLGIASFPAHARDAEELIKHADIAMYQAKATRSGYDFYASERDTNSRARLSLAGELAAALQDNRLEVHYQPKVDAAQCRIVGVEALVRLCLPDGRLVPPLEFLRAAEHAGLSRALTRKVLALALTQLAIWRSDGHDLHVAVNTTVPDLCDVEFPREVAGALAAQDLPPEALILEVTESSVLSDPFRIGNVLAQLAALGIGLSLDDFGTGYSSLAHLKSLPVAEVKVDRSFVAAMCTDAADAAIVGATIGLAHRLGMTVVAEGVEDEQTCRALQDLDCELIQGYVFSRPVPAAELESLLSAKHAARPTVDACL